MSFTTASTSVVLVPTATSNSPFYVYLNNVSTAGRIVTVRDNDGYASFTNSIVIAPRNGAYFMDGTSSITINQPYGYVTFNTALNGGYGVLNTFGFPTGSSAAFVSNVTSCNLTTSTLSAQLISAPTAIFNTVNINTISTGNIIINRFSPSTITTNSISTGTITGGSVSFQTIFGSTIQTNELQLPLIIATVGNFGSIVASNVTTSNFAMTGDVTISATGSNVHIGSNTTASSRGVAIGGNAKAAVDSVSLGFAAGSNNQGALATSVGVFSGATNQGVQTVAFGYGAGSNAQGSNATSIGHLAGASFQNANSVAVGAQAGLSSQGADAIGVGFNAGASSQGQGAVAIGSEAGATSQGASSIAIGYGAGQTSQGGASIAIGTFAGQTNQHANTMILNATGAALNSATPNALYIAPIRNDQTGVGSRVAVYYNQVTKEMTTGPATGTDLIVSSIVTSSIATNVITATRFIGGSLQTNTISSGTITGAGLSTLSVSTGTILANSIQTNTISSGTATFGIGTMASINTNAISTNSITVGSLNVNSLSTGSIVLTNASIGSISTNTISTGTITANVGTISTFTAGSLVANTGRMGSLSTNFISANAVLITGPTTMTNRRTQSVFVANGNDTIDLKYSLNGVTWCNSITNGAFSGAGAEVDWNGSLFVAVGTDSIAANTIKYSTDGSNWFNSASGGFSAIGYDVAWNGRMWVAAGQDATSQGRIKYSLNGSNWSNANTTTFSVNGSKIGWGNGRWVVSGVDAGGAANSILTSTDGSNWAFATNQTGATATCPFYNGQTWLLGANGTNSNAILYSSNALVWSRVETTAFTTGCYSLAWNGQTWVAVGEGGATIQTSANGMVWTPATSGLFNSSGYSITWSGTMWVAGGYDTGSAFARIKTSMDGSNWNNTDGATYVGGIYGIVYSKQLVADVTTQEMNLYSQNIPNVLQSTNQILALTSSLVLNNTLYVNRPANYVGINAPVPQAPLHVVGGLNGQTSQILLQTLGSTLNTSLFISTNVGQATLGVVGPSNGFLTNTIPGDTVLTSARTTNRLVMGNGSSIGLFISSGTVVVPGTLAIGGAISTASISSGSASFNAITVRSSTIVSTLFFTGDVSIQAATDEIRIGSNAGITGQRPGAVALGAAAGQTTQGSSAVALGALAGQTTQGSSAVALGAAAGQTNQGNSAVALGTSAGQTTQGEASVAIGQQSGNTTQGGSAVAIGDAAGVTSQGFAAIAVGYNAGYGLQGQTAIAVGYNAGFSSQAGGALAIGFQAGYNLQASNATAIGIQAGGNAQGPNAIAIGTFAGQTNQHASTIILNATGGALNSATANALYIAPIRNDQGITGARNIAYYNPITKEITTGPTTNLVLSSLTISGAGTFPSISTNVVSTTTINATTITATNLQASQVSSISVYASNLGVRTTTPQYTLDVNGQAWVRSTFYVGNSLRNNQIRFYGTTGDSPGTFNTTVIGERLYGGTESSELLLFKAQDPDTTNGPDRVRVQASGGFQVDAGIFGSPFIWPEGGAPPTATYPNALVVSGSNGFVGIGTTTPFNTLDVNGQVWSRSTLYLGSNQSGAEIRFSGTVTDGAGQFTHTVIAERVYGGTEDSELLLYKGNDNNSLPAIGPDRVRVLASGGFQVDVGGMNTPWSQGGGAPPVATYSNALNVSGETGYVGLGTSGPSTILHIRGPAVTSAGSTQCMITGTGAIPNTAINIQNTFGQVFFGVAGSNDQYLTGILSGDTFIRTGNAATTKKLLIGNAGGVAGICLSNNLVGIGMTSPAYPLDVNGSAKIQIAGIGENMLYAGVRTHAEFSHINFRNTSNYAFMQESVGHTFINCKWQSNIYIKTGNQDIMFLDGSNRRVGIGTLAPLNDFDVNGRTYLRSTLYLGSSATGSEIRFHGTTSDGVGQFTHTVIAERLYEAGTEKSELLLYKGNDSIATAGPDRVRVLAAGGFQVDCGGAYSVSEWAQGGGAPPVATFSNAFVVSGTNGFVGIGTATPDYPLRVNGTLFVHSTITCGYAAPGMAQNIQIDGHGHSSPISGRISFGTDNTGWQLRFSRRQGGAYQDIMTLTDTNRVGIGLTNPSYQLELSQNSAAKPTSGSWTTTSDERAKKNIVAADSFICYSTLKGIPLKYFEWNIYDPETQSTIGTDDKHSIGFIAQEVEKVFPNAVTTRERYGYSDFRSLDVDQLYKMHYGATQHIGQEVERQSTMIQTLTTQVTELQQAVSTLMGRSTV